MKDTIHTSNNSSEVITQETSTEISVFEQAIYQQEQQFQTGIKNLKKEIDTIFQIRNTYTPIVGNRASRFLTKKIHLNE